MTYEPTWGPWVGVPESKRYLCAVEGCEDQGHAQVCVYDGRRHHHGCIHYDCGAAEVTKHGLTFRDGWGWLCEAHYDVLKRSQQALEAARANPTRGLVAAE